METANDGAEDENLRLRSDADSQGEIVWSVGDQCQAKWSGDDKLYPGVVKKLKHFETGRVEALVQFSGYDSDDSEAVDIQLLRKIVKEADDKRSQGTGKELSENGEKLSGLFRPFSGSEYFIRLENKYGYESDSDSDDRSSKSDWISPTPYQTKGKVSEWKVRSPAKSRALPRRGKASVVCVGSPRKKTGDGKKSQAVQKNVGTPDLASPKANRTATAVVADGPASADGRSSPVSENGEERNFSERRNATSDMDDSTFQSPANREGLFEGFDEEDMEKPKFNFPAPVDKVPFSLSDNTSAQIPASLNQYLRDYQREGIQFLYSHYIHNRGAILGDDMGLGKTVQVIGFLSALMGKQGNRLDVMRQKPRFIRLMSDTPCLDEEKKCRPFLIIGPGSVLYNWLEELDTWAHFTVRKYHGVDKASCLADVLRGKVEVVVTTFETCRDNIAALNKVKWEAVIVDEVHRIKGLKAQTTQALRTLKCIRRFGLTGTALQNSMSELWCLLDWAQPDVLGGAEDFTEDFVRPIELGQKQNATKRELAEARQKKEVFAKVRSQMLLRRTKKLIADQLPVKTDRVVFCRLSPLQVSVYKAVLSHPDMEDVLNMDRNCDCGSGLTRGKCCFKKLRSGKSPKSVIFTFMHVLLKTANHVALLIPHTRMSPEKERHARQLCDIAFQEHPEFLSLTRDAAFRTLSDPTYCGKMKVLQGMLSVFAKSHSKVLVFSYSTRLLDILEQHIISECHEYRRIDGAVTGRRRQEIVREFNTDPNIFLCLVSTKAGGLGLNMTGANKVVIFDPNWNPSHDLQAQDRAYRIGQRRDVEVFRLVSAGSIEENIYLRQVYKQQLDNVAVGSENARRYFQGIQGDADNKGELFGIKNMFRLRTGDSCLTMDILSRNAKVEAGIAGYQMADYVPSWREQQNAEEGSSMEEESEAGNSGDAGESSDEETLKSFKDLFEAVSDDEEKQPEVPKKLKPVDSEPKPSISGLNTHRKKAATPSTTSKTLHLGGSAEPDSSDEGDRIQWSKPTTRQRKSQDTDGRNVWTDRTCATDVLDFLEEGSESVRSKGKALKRKHQKSMENRAGVTFRGGAKTGQGQPSVEDSLVTPLFSSVTSVFEECGVIHVHDNPQVVGASRVEDHITRCAMKEVFELSANTQDPALLCDPMSQPSEDEAEKSKTPTSKSKGQRARGKTAAKDHNSAKTVEHGRWHILVGQTPTAIRRKQWSHIKEFNNSHDDLTLAQRVVMASPEERLAMLKEMYKHRHENTLHGALDDILSKPAEPPDEPAEGKGSARKAETSTSVKNQSRRRKRPQQPRATPAKKQPVRRKHAARGLLYDDEDDTQPSQQPKKTHIDDGDLSSDDSGFDIGAKISPAKMKATPKRRRGRTLQTLEQSIVSPSLDRTVEASSKKKVSWVEEHVVERHSNSPGSLPTEDVDGLLKELGEKHANTKPCQKQNEKDHKQSAVTKGPPLAGRKQSAGEVSKGPSAGAASAGKGNLAFLDDIFSNQEDSEKKQRKPPPSRGHKQVPERSDGINSRGSRNERLDIPSTSGTSGARRSNTPSSSGGVYRSSTTSSSEVFSDLMNNSTLADDSVDCFGEPSQWKKRKKVRKAPVKKIDRLLQETTDGYLQLFESGRLVKKRQKEKRVVPEGGGKRPAEKEENVFRQEVERRVSSDIDPSGSLF